MRALEQVLGGPAIEAVAKATRRRFTVEYKRKILREADAVLDPWLRLQKLGEAATVLAHPAEGTM
jgi:hypothetical protein